LNLGALNFHLLASFPQFAVKASNIATLQGRCRKPDHCRGRVRCRSTSCALRQSTLVLLLCWFLDAGNNGTLRMLSGPASKKRQGTKSREVGHRPGSERYGDLMPAPSSMIDVTLAGFELGVCTYGRIAECIRHFGECSERIGARSAH
jgi:hypothetical protein